MAGDDEDENLDNEDIETGTDGGGATGQDTAGRDEASELPAEQSDRPADDGEPQPSTGGEPTGQSRGGARFQRLNDRVRSLEGELERERRERHEERRQQWANNAAANEQQERERVALMTDSERATYENSKFRREMEARSNYDRAQLHFVLDKNAFEAKATVHPIYAKYKDEVEKRFQEQLAKGQPVEREVIFKFMLGERSLEGALKAPRQARQAQRRVENERVAASSGRSDQASQRGRAGDTAESRLKDVLI